VIIPTPVLPGAATLPTQGALTSMLFLTYDDGVKQRVKSRMPCS